MRKIVILLVAAQLTSAPHAAPLPDPMRPSYARQATPKSIARRDAIPQLQGVFGDAKMRIAVLDGQVIEIGGQIGRFRVTNIYSDSIELRNGKRRVVARIGESK